jgi:hypothetical protein
MRRFLYLTPYFPPQSRVGALRPLKFARHLPAHGWEPVILCDLWPGAATSAALLEAVPPQLTILRDYSARARLAEAALGQPATARSPRAASPWWERRVPAWLQNPELVPLGEHSVHMPHAWRAARRALRERRCEAIMVNADPWAAMVVGAALARQTGLPLIQDLRDPWAPCALRRPRRPAPIRALVDALERWTLEPAARVILNTEAALADYRRHYPDLPAARFTCIRNHSDAALIGHGVHAGFDRFTLLFLGGFRRFVEGEALLDLLVGLARRGVSAAQLQLVVTGEVPAQTWEMARARGVEAYLKKHAAVPYHQIGPVMDNADVLVALNNHTTQRIPAKFYDYATTRRPILIFADNPELGELLARHQGALFGLDEADAAAAHVLQQLAAGRGVIVERDARALSSEAATARLAALLNGASPSPVGS